VFSILELTASVPTIRILDLGAMTFGAMTEPYSALQKIGISKVIGFEPVVAECEKLKAIYPENTYLPCFVGDGSSRTFYTTNHTMTSSLYAPNEPIMDMFENLSDLVRVVATDEIKTERLSELLALSGDIDYIKADIQGAEYDVFTNAGPVLDSVLVIQTEVEFVEIYKNQPLFSDVDMALRSRGFQFHRFVNMSGRLYKGLPQSVASTITESQQLWADAVYIRAVQQWSALSATQLLKMAAILHEVYQSFDLTYKALALHDNKAATDLTKTYLTLLAEHSLKVSSRTT